jgi:CheY-like chemotaxis protein
MCKRIHEVLLIDDDVISNLINKRLISKKWPEIKVDSFTSGEDALKYLRLSVDTKTPICIFLDINMPNINGWDFLKIISSEFRLSNWNIIFLTSSIDPKEKERAMKNPFVQEFFIKPLQPKCLDKIENHLLGT